MNRLRLVGVSVVVIMLVAITGLFEGRPPLENSPASGPGVPVVGAESDISSTWFCTAGTAPLDPAPHHQIFISNNGSKRAPVRISGYGPEGKVGVKDLEVGPGGTQSLDLDVAFAAAGLSAMVESPRGGVAVSSWVISGEVADSSPCQRDASALWYFPSQTTLLNTTANLVLFNPFSSDAGVDIAAAVSDGVRSPNEWAGIVVPAGSTKVVDLATQIQRRDQFAITVKVRSGRVFAESIQTYSGVTIGEVGGITGLRLTSPIAAPRVSWTMAGGFKDAGANESIVIYNPNSDTTSVRVQVVPYGSTDLAPEPFDVRVPGRRYSILDLGEEGRVPDVGFHSITVESQPTAPVVVQRRLRLSDKPAANDTGATTRVPLDKGVAASTGAAGAADDWIIDAVLTGGDNEPMAFVQNPGTKPVTVSISTIGDDDKPAMVLKNQRIAPRDGVAVPLSIGSIDTPATRLFVVDSNGPVTVEILRTFESIPDFTITAAFPLEPTK